MPVVPNKVANTADTHEGGTFEVLPPGVYTGTLLKVELKQGPAGPYLAWTYRVEDPEQFKGRQLFNNTSYAEGAAFKLKEAFAAHGRPVKGTDTDDLCGEQVTLHVVQQTIQAGSRQGELGNQIKRVMPLRKSVAAGVGASGDEDDDDDDNIPF